MNRLIVVDARKEMNCFERDGLAKLRWELWL